MNLNRLEVEYNIMYEIRQIQLRVVVVVVGGTIFLV